MGVLWRAVRLYRYSRRQNENSGWSDIDLSPRAATSSRVSPSLYISLHADLGTRLHMRSYFSDTDHQPVFYLVPEDLKLDCYLTPKEYRFEASGAAVFL